MWDSALVQEPGAHLALDHFAVYFVEVNFADLVADLVVFECDKAEP